MFPKNQLEQEEDALCEQLNRGEISSQEYHKRMQEIQREYNDMARESAQEAYDREMERW